MPPPRAPALGSLRTGRERTAPASVLCISSAAFTPLLLLSLWGAWSRCGDRKASGMLGSQRGAGPGAPGHPGLPGAPSRLPTCPAASGRGNGGGRGRRMGVSQDGCAEGGGVDGPPPFRALLSPLPVRPPRRATHQEGAPPQEGRSPKPDAGSRREAPLLRSRLVFPADSAGLQQSDPQAGTRTGKSAWPRRGQEGPAAPSTHSGLSLTGSPAQRGSGWGAGPRESCSEQPACAARRGAVSCTRPRARVWGRRPTVPPPQPCFPESHV